MSAREQSKEVGKDAKEITIIHPPVSLDEHVAVQRENKVRTLLLQALPEDHMPDFHHYDDARDIWMAVKARFGGNEESKKMRKTMLKQQFTEFSVTEEEGLHKGYDRFQKILSQLNQVQARPDNDDINLKFLRALPSSWSQVALALKTRGGLESMSFDDLYNKLRSLELDVRIGHSYGVKAAAAPTHSAFIGAASSGSKLNYSNQQNQDMIYEDFDQVDQLEMEELDLKWQMAMLSLRINRFEKKAGRKMNYNNQQPARFDRRKVDDKARYSAFKVTEVKTDEPKALVSVDSMVNWSDHAAENKTGEVEKVYGMMAGLHAIMGAGLLYNDCYIKVQAYQNAVKTLESQKDCDKSSDSETYASCDSSLKTKTKDFPPAVDIKTLPESDVEDPNSLSDCDFYNCVESVPCKSKAASVPAGSRNSPASVTADGSDPAASRNRPAVNSAGRPNPADGVLQLRPQQVKLLRIKRPQFLGVPRCTNVVVVKGGIVKFGGGDGRISGKGTIRTSKLDFENVYYVEELQHFNLFSVSQICDKKNKVLFTDTDCLVLTEDFQLPDESIVLSPYVASG
ncbi:hypothetical protein Tco_0390041 [Tanacetum coccineum]